MVPGSRRSRTRVCGLPPQQPGEEVARSIDQRLINRGLSQAKDESTCTPTVRLEGESGVSCYVVNQLMIRCFEGRPGPG